MKLNKLTCFALASLAFVACDMEDVVPQGGTLLATQVKESNEAAPSRVNASFTGMFTKMGMPLATFGSSGRADDFAFISMAYSNDMEGVDIVTPNSGYNWFSVCGELSSRSPNYANPMIRYSVPYNEIAMANTVITSYPADTEDPTAINQMAQARAIRAFSYLQLAPYFQVGFSAGGAELPSVPLVTEETTDFTNNPRATMADVYDLIVKDLTWAIEHLEGYQRPDKMKIDQNVAYGLRARAYLDMGKYAEAAADAEKAMAGYTPATIEEVSQPSFFNLDDHNWLWGYDMTEEIAKTFRYATASSWVRSFSGWGYAAGAGVYAQCNVLLYDKISDTDVRKGWWVDENLQSPLLEHVTWGGVTGQGVATLEIADEKMVFEPYTNVKFGMYTYGSTTNEEDWPFMRVEEMILIKAEGLANTPGKEAEGRQVLEDFVKTYRDPSYSSLASGRTLSDEIWFQRRVELWGEGFANSDLRRLHKPLVRFHEGKESNMPEAFRFNMPADDPWWLMRFTDSETNTNLAIVDNEGGQQPVQDQHGDLRDGVTD